MPGTPSFGSPPSSPSPCPDAPAAAAEPSPTFGSAGGSQSDTHAFFGSGSGSPQISQWDTRVAPPPPPCNTPRRGDLQTEPEVVDELAAAVPSEAQGSTSHASRDYQPDQKYRFLFNIGKGAFGKVYVAEAPDGARVAVKSVELDDGREMREVEILQAVKHPCVVAFVEAFHAPGADGRKILHIVMEYLPQNLHDHMGGRPLEHSTLRYLTFQLLHALAGLDALKICHRDVKPENLVLDGPKNVLKLCDFGSAKRLCGSAPSTSYICARWWRAPELVLGATMYSTSVDWWSAGCVLAEMMLGRPLFAGSTSWDQLGEIARALGVPSDKEVNLLVPEGLQPKVAEDLAQLRQAAPRPRSWEELVPHYANSREVLDLLKRLLVYDPGARLSPARSLCSELFAKLPEEVGRFFPHLFHFTREELESLEPEVARALRSFGQRRGYDGGFVSDTTASPSLSTSDF